MASKVTLSTLRQTMRTVPQPVVVVTCELNGTKRGITCSSFTSISDKPPIITFATNRPSSMEGILANSKRHAVHLLSADQMGQSVWFSSPKTQQDFTRYPYFQLDNLPVLQGCLSTLVCTINQTIDVGDHRVWYSNVVDIIPDGVRKLPNSPYSKARPLIYYESSYRSIGDEVFIEQFENTSLKFTEWTHRAHLRMAFIYLRDPSIPNPIELIKYPIVTREGIKRYNMANAAKLTHGYHETITMFFCKMVQYSVNNAGESCTDFLDFLERYPWLDNFELIYNYYSRDLLYSEQAKLK